MKRKWLGISICIIAALCAAYTKPQYSDRPTYTKYFLYLPQLDFTESGFENPDNWIEYNFPSNIFCFGYSHPCVVQINADDIIHYGNNSPEEDFVAKLINITSVNPYTVYGYSYTNSTGYCYGESSDSKN